MSNNSQQYPAPEGSGPPAPVWGPPQGAPQPVAGPDRPGKKMGKGKKIGLWTGGVVVALAIIGSMGNDPKTAPTAATDVAASTTSPSPTPAAPTTTVADQAAADKAAADKAAAAKAAADKAAADKAANAMTVSQEQAVNQAESYLEMTAFSRKGLIKQLEFEEFSKADAKYAVDHISVNWNEQAAKQARSYLDMTAFSHGSLLRQLKFEGFTSSQAAFGVKSVGL